MTTKMTTKKRYHPCAGCDDWKYHPAGFHDGVPAVRDYCGVTGNELDVDTMECPRGRDLTDWRQKKTK